MREAPRPRDLLREYWIGFWWGTDTEPDYDKEVGLDGTLTDFYERQRAAFESDANAYYNWKRECEKELWEKRGTSVPVLEPNPFLKAFRETNEAKKAKNASR